LKLSFGVQLIEATDDFGTRTELVGAIATTPKSLKESLAHTWGQRDIG
jgi:hypothetical protein